MRQIYVALILILLLESCQNSHKISLSKGEGLFISELLQNRPDIKNKKNLLVFVLNKPECKPCENEIVKLGEHSFSNTSKLFVVASTRKPMNFESSNAHFFDHKKLAQYGFQHVYGRVLILQKGKCTFLESINIKNIESLKERIESSLRKYP